MYSRFPDHDLDMWKRDKTKPRLLVRIFPNAYWLSYSVFFKPIKAFMKTLKVLPSNGFVSPSAIIFVV